ncbi:MAG: MaoC family dehydratase [Deltaproteobacteria bacterium]|nr:MaoC family dehydratase [Deltaproteobacteria bacterium]
MNDEIRIEDFLITKKQKEFEYDFFKKAEEYEKWEDVDFDGVYESERTFVVEEEDIKAYSEGILDDNFLFNDREAAEKGPFRALTAHPLFLTSVGFWLTGDSGPGSWVRTPGAINPGQVIEFYEPICLGDTIRATHRFHDKWIKRGKRYLTYVTEYFNQKDQMVAKWWITLILPRSKGVESHNF